MKKSILEKVFTYTVIIFLIIQPIFDLKVFYNSYSTLIRTIITIVLFLICFLKDKDRKKYLLLIYPSILCIYFIFHNINALKFKSLVPGNFNYSTIKEFLYFTKMLVPLMLIYVLYKSNIKNSRYTDIIKCLTIVIGGIIIITNILGISYSSYTDTQIEKSFIHWFSKESSQYTYKELLSKGLFEFANQIGAILIIFLPFNIFNVLKEGKGKVSVFINLFSIILLGTRTAILGTIIVIGYMCFIRLFYYKYQKEKNINKKNYIFIAILVFIYMIMLPKNPVFNRIDEMMNLQEKTVQTIGQSNEPIGTNEGQIIQNAEDGKINNDSYIDIKDTQDCNIVNNKIKYIEENYKAKDIHEQFILNSYPYQYDPDFWIDVMNKDIKIRTDYRYLEKAMIKRIIEYNNNLMDKVLGISNVRVQNVFNIEQDFIVHYYSLGIIGCILIFLPYMLIIGRIINEIINKSKLKKIISEERIIALVTIMFLYGIAYNSGNLLNSLSFTIYFSIIYAKLIIKNEEDNNVF